MPPNRSPSRRKNQVDVENNDDDSSSHDPKSDQVLLLRNLLWLLPVTLAALLLIMGSLYLHNIEHSGQLLSARNVIKHVSKNLKAKPFTAIKHEVAATPCATGQTELELGEFGGINAGCLCKDGSVHSRAYCVLHTFGDNCAWVKEVKGGQVKIFKAGTNPAVTHLCAKLVSKYEHTKEADCPAGYVTAPCAKQYCVETGSTCPLNHIKTNSLSPLRQLSINHSHAHPIHAPAANQILPAPQNFELEIDTNSGTSVLAAYTGVEVITGDNLCWDLERRDQKQSQKNYALSKVQETGCGEFGEVSYTSGDATLILKQKQTYDDLLDVNQLKAGVNGAKFWSDSLIVADDKISLVLTRRIEIDSTNEECYRINPNDIDKLETEINALKTDVNGIFIAILCIVSLMLLVALIFYIFKDKTFVQFDFKTRSSTKILIILGVIASILAIAAGIVYYVKVGSAEKFDKEYNTYLEKKCFAAYKTSIEAALKVVLKYVKEQHGDLGHLTVGAFATGIAFIGSIAIALVLKQKTGTPLFDGPFIRD